MTIGDSGRDLLFSIVLLPLCETLMMSPRIAGRPLNKQRGITVALAVLIGVSACKIGYELTFKEESFYDMLGVSPTAHHTELKKGYKRESLKVHPDKLQAEGVAAGLDAEAAAAAADDAFVALKAAYDAVSDTAKRDMYDKFGKPGLDFNENETTSLLAGLGFFYVVWVALAYLLTRSRTVSRAQTWAFSGLLALGIFEYQARILAFDFLQDALPGLAMFEKIELLHRLYPVYLIGARLVAWLMHEDLDEKNFVMLQQLHWKTDRLRERIFMLAKHRSLPPPADGSAPSLGPDDAVTPEMWQAFAKETVEPRFVEALKVGGPGVLSALGGGAAAKGNGTTAAAAAGEAAGGEAAAGGETAAAMASLPGGVPPVAKPAPAKPAGGGGRSLGSLVWFFGVYFFFQWLLGRSK